MIGIKQLKIIDKKLIFHYKIICNESFSQILSLIAS